MRKGYLVWAAVVATAWLLSAGPAGAAQKVSPGEEAFAQNCAVCHPNGDNIINPDKKLAKKSLAANGVRTAADIVNKMRKPGPGMTEFDQKAIPDATAKAIAEYILDTFK
jgi:cytochrome c6